MAATAHKSEEEKKEFFDSSQVLDRKVNQLANMILASEHFIAFTGAGISTSTGIPDYRSGAKTVLKTGPGCWTKLADIQAAKKAGHKVIERPKVDFRTSILKATPSSCHMALSELMKADRLKYVVSQNIDGLHRKSGIPKDQISEVHGNTNLEYCAKCGKDYMRDFRVRNAQKVHDHYTGRFCTCGGKLRDSIINFGEYYRQGANQAFDKAATQGELADLMLCLGSSLRVYTDAMDECLENGGKLVIVNLQKTPYTSQALQIYARIDDVMNMLMEKLNMAVS